MPTIKQYFAAASLILSAGGAAIIAQDEGIGPTVQHTGQTLAVAYADPALGWDVPTVCHGHTRGVFRGQRATLEQCQAWLIEDAGAAGRAIARCTPVELTQQQYDALVSFVFNVGGGNYCSSTLARRLRADDCFGAAREISRWTRSGGRVLPGLVKRRAGERARFEADCRKES